MVFRGGLHLARTNDLFGLSNAIVNFNFFFSPNSINIVLTKGKRLIDQESNSRDWKDSNINRQYVGSSRHWQMQFICHGKNESHRWTRKTWKNAHQTKSGNTNSKFDIPNQSLISNKLYVFSDFNIFSKWLLKRHFAERHKSSATRVSMAYEYVGWFAKRKTGLWQMDSRREGYNERYAVHVNAYLIWSW